MANTNAYTPASAAYAEALLDLADDSAVEVGDELHGLVSVVQGDSLIRAFFNDPAIAVHERWEVIQKSFSGRSSDLLKKFLGVLNEKGRMALLPQIDVAYRSLLDHKLNRVRVKVTVARKLEDQELAQVGERVSAALGKIAIVEQKVDDSIIGGLVIQLEDKIIDGSVKAQLEAMRKQLLASRVNIRA